MKRECPHCKRALPEEANFCMHCMEYASPVRALPEGSAKGSNKKIKYLLLIAGTAAIITAAFFVLISFNKGDKAPVTQPSAAALQTEAQTTAPASAQSTAAPTTATTTHPATSTTKKTTTETTSTTQSVSVVIISEVHETTTKKKKEKKTTAAPDVSPLIKDSVLVSYPKEITKKTYKIPYGVKKINDKAFDNRHLTTLYFSKREKVECNWQELFKGLPNLKTIYIYPGTAPDLEGKGFFKGKIVYL